jgi:hypothetical protein
VLAEAGLELGDADLFHDHNLVKYSHIVNQP